MNSSGPNNTEALGENPVKSSDMFSEPHSEQTASATFLSTDPNNDDGGLRASQELWENIARKPVKLPHEDNVHMWEKAAADPKSITEEDRLRILERFPLDDFNEKCHAICGRTLEELLEKAVNDPSNLTQAEAQILIYGVEKRTLEDDNANQDFLRWPSDLRQLKRDAIAAAETPRDGLALQNARAAQRRLLDEKSEAREILSEDDRKNVVWCNRSDWVRRLERDQPDQEWGFVLYRTWFGDDQAWGNFQQELERLTNVALKLVKGSEGIRKRWKIHYIEEKKLEGASLETLAEFVNIVSHLYAHYTEPSNLRDFRNRLPSQSDKGICIPAHLRQDAFLFADSEAIKSALPPNPKSPMPDTPRRSWVWAADATHTAASLQTYKHGFQGSVKVCLPNLLTTFVARLARRGSEDDKPDVTNKMMQSWDVVYYKARYDRGGKVYPPVSIYNRGS